MTSLPEGLGDRRTNESDRPTHDDPHLNPQSMRPGRPLALLSIRSG